MRECWLENPEMRPTFEEIGKILHSVFEAVDKLQASNEGLATSHRESSPITSHGISAEAQPLSKWKSDTSCNTVTSFLDPLPEGSAPEGGFESFSTECAQDPYNTSQGSTNIVTIQGATSNDVLDTNMLSHTLGMPGIEAWGRMSSNQPLDCATLISNMEDAKSMAEEAKQLAGWKMVKCKEKKFSIDDGENTVRKQEEKSSVMDAIKKRDYMEDYKRGQSNRYDGNKRDSDVESDNSEDEDNEEYGYYDQDEVIEEKDEKEKTAEIQPSQLLQKVQQELRMQVANASRALSLSTNPEDTTGWKFQPLEPKQFLQPVSFPPQPRKPITRSGCFRHSGNEYVKLDKPKKLSQKPRNMGGRRLTWAHKSSSLQEGAPTNSADVDDYLKPT